MAYRFAHRVLANSPSVGETVVRDEGVNRERVVVIPNFVEEAAFTPLSADRRTVLRREVGLAPDDLAVGIIANLYPVKNHAMLMRAAGRLAAARPDVRFVLIGEGNEREALTRLRHELRLDDRVVMPGRMANEPGLAGIFDIAVLTSVEEGFPNWIVEAMAAGRAVVATSVGGVPDAVLDGETGVLVGSGDDEALASALDRLLGDDDLRHRMGATASARARTLYHVDTVMAALESLYEGLAARCG
jgi:glycosyltransferase involved in cell wall biosynthesis